MSVYSGNDIEGFLNELDQLRARLKSQRAMSKRLANSLTKSADFIAYLLSHLPDDARDNSIWVESQEVLKCYRGSAVQAGEAEGREKTE